MIRNLRRIAKKYLPHQRRYYEDLLFRRVTDGRLTRLFDNLGVREGMLIYVQSAFGSLGYYSKGAAGLIDLLSRLVGPSGTVAMPSFPFSDSMEEFVKRRQVFDVARTPSVVGALPEVLRQLPQAQRSLHPTHPVVAVGGQAAGLTEGHERCRTPQGAGSPFEKLVQWGGHILRIGTPALPVCHHLQELVNYPNLFLPEPAALDCLDAGGRVVHVETMVYRRRVPFVFYMDGSVPDAPIAMNIFDFPLLFSGRENQLRDDTDKLAAVERLLEIRQAFVSAGNLRAASLNGCACELFPLKPVFDFAVPAARSLIERYKAHYALASLTAGLESGRINI
jgi:aminoglycoside N3'-acetyltransferase